MIVHDVATKVLDTKIFHQRTITDLISDIKFIVLFSQKKPLWWKNIDTHRHTQTDTCTHTHTHTHTHKHTRFQQIIEDSTCLFPENRHFDQNFSRQYALDWKDNQECSDVLRYSDPPTGGSLGCVINLKNSVIILSQEIEFLGMAIAPKKRPSLFHKRNYEKWNFDF